MYAANRCYKGVEESQLAELTRKIDEGLIPRLSKLPGFDGYFLLEGGGGTSGRSACSRPSVRPRIRRGWPQSGRGRKTSKVSSSIRRSRSRRCSLRA